jgi:guanylate kinase
MPKGKLIVVSAPSGSGKTTIVKAVLAAHPRMLFSVSATTRPIRNGEVDGMDYFFLTREEFEHRIKAGQLVEWEEIYGDLYGTLKSEVERALSTHKAMLFDIDVKGALSIKRHYPHDAILIFIRPPSVEVLKSRLLNRRTEDEETLKRRLDRASMELHTASEFDYQVVNDNLQTAVAEINRIVASAAQPALQ